MNHSSSAVFETLAASGALLFGQGDRLLRLRFAASAGIAEDTLLPYQVQGAEALSANYLYRIDCLSADAYLELKDLLSSPLELAILLPDGGERVCSGLVTRAEHRGADGGFALYKLTVEPALATLAHRRNSRVFQDKSVPQIVAAILDEHIAGNPVFTRSFRHQARLNETYPRRSYCLQYRESDLSFIERLLAEEGISYRYTHGPDANISLRDGEAVEDDSASGETPVHTLILFDANHQLPQNNEDALRFHRSDGIETDDAIDRWAGSRQIEPGKSALASFDYKAVSTQSGSEETRIEQGEDGSTLASGLEDYDPQTLYYGSDPHEITPYTKLRQQQRDLASKAFSGEGSVRRLCPGSWFELADHPIHDQDNIEDREFIVVSLNFEGENNLTPEAKQGLGGLLTGNPPQGGVVGQNRPPYRNAFTAVRRHIPIVPEYSRTTHQKPTAGGMTTATVVGPAEEEIFTDEHGRIKIQFHWQRPQDHPEGGADFDDKSSTWVRVSSPSAGAAWGTSYIPRIGQEVVVSFIENDIDRPLVTGVLYNGTHRPPNFSGAGNLPANKTLSGTKSKEYKGGRYNELVFDDSTGEIRTKLSSEHGKTQLNEGFLIHPRTQGKGEPRGEGFELRTDNHGAIRAAQGLYLTTEAQNGASGKQLSREHAHSQLEAALALASSLAEVAAKQAADTLETGPEKIDPDNQEEEKAHSGHLEHHAQALAAWEAGSNTDKDGRSAKDEPGRQPLLVMSAPAGIASLTGQNQTLAAGTNLDLIAQRDTNQTSGRRWLHNVGQHVSLFVNGVKDKISLKLIAAQGNAQLQTQHGSIEITGDQDVTVTACKGQVVVAAKQEILLTSGGGYIRIKDGNIDIHCPGTVSIKAAHHDLTGPTSMNVPFPQFPGSVCLPCLLAALKSGSPFVAPAS